MPRQRGTVQVVLVSGSLCAESNSYEVQFGGPNRFFDNELWRTKQLVSGTLQRVLNEDGSWMERLLFSTGQAGSTSRQAPVLESPGGGAVESPGGGAVATPGGSR